MEEIGDPVRLNDVFGFFDMFDTGAFEADSDGIGRVRPGEGCGDVDRGGDG